MKRASLLYFSFLIFHLSFSAALSSCHTSKSSVSLQESSETASLRSSRLSTSLSIDTITKYFALNADSLVFIFGETPSGRFSEDNPYGIPIPAEKSIPSSDDLSGSSDDVYFFSGPAAADKSAQERSHRPSSPSLGVGKGVATLKVYGLHTSAGSSKQSIQQSSSSDSNDKSVQSEKHEEDTVKKSSPDAMMKITIFILIIAVAIIFLKMRQ